MQVFSETSFGLTLMLPSLVTNGLRRDKEGPFKKKLFLRPHHFFRSLYIMDVRKDAAVIFNV